jgi:putative ABC transport system permease protein
VKLVWMLAWRHLSHRPGATLLSALGIALGIATVVSVITLDHNTLLSQQMFRAPSDPGSDLLIQPLDSSSDSFAAQAQRLANEPFLRGVTGFTTAKWALIHDGVTRAGVEIMAVEEAARSYHGGYLIDEGVDLDYASDAPQIVVTRGLVEHAGLAVGDIVQLTRPPSRRAPATRCVDGKMVVVNPGGRGAPTPRILHDFEIVGILSPTSLGYHTSRVILPFGAGRRLLGDQATVRFWADLDIAQTDFLGIENRLREEFVVYAPKRSMAGQAPEEAAFRAGVRMCAFLALFLGLYIIFNTMSMSLVERVRQIGLLRALGVTRGRLLAIFLTEGGVLSLMGALLSVGMSIGIVGAMKALRITTLGFGKPLEIVELPIGPILAVMFAGVLFSLMGIVYPFLRASRLSVIDALRRGVIELSRDPFTGARRSILIGLLAIVPVAWFIGAPSEGFIAVPLWEAFLQAIAIVGGAIALLLLFSGLLPGLAGLLMAPLRGPAIVLARSTVASARHRVFSTVTGLMLVFAAVFLVVSVLESLKAETRQFAERALAGRLYIRTTPDGADRMEELRTIPGLGNLTPVDVDVTSPFLVRALDKRMLGVGSLAGNARAASDFARKPTLILSSRCADDFGYVKDGWVTLATAADGPVDFRVLAVTDEYGFAPDDRVFAAISIENMRRYWCRDANERATQFAAWAPQFGPDDQARLGAAIRAGLGEENLLSLRFGDRIGEGYLTNLNRDFGIFYAILVLTVMLAALGVLNAMVIAVMERRREIGLLRVVGLTGGQVARMLLVESGAFGVLGGVLGLIVGIPLATLSARTLTAMSHLDLVFSLTAPALTAVLAGAILVALLAVLYPAMRANSLRLSTVMRYE